MASQDKTVVTGAPAPQRIDSMEKILAQWREARPDIDPTPMAVCGQILRSAEIIRKGLNANWANYGLDFAGADVILTLRRQGIGATSSPSELAKDMMLSTSAMTNRLDRLEKRGFVKRTTDPNDRRGLKIVLTEDGQALADEMVVTHVETEAQMIAALTDAEQDLLRSLLNKIAAT